MDSNHQDKTGSKQEVANVKLWTPPLSPKDQERLDLLRKKQNEQKQGIGKFFEIGDMKLKDWIQLLFIPLILALAGFSFNSYQQTQAQLSSQQQSLVQLQQSFRLASEQQQTTTLQTYLDTIQDLMLNHKLGNPLKHDGSSDDLAIQGAREIARARTLLVLEALSSSRETIIIQFLYNSHLIVSSNPIIDLSGASLSYVYLGGMNLINANLVGVNLTGADFTKTDLRGADLKDATGIIIKELEAEAKSLQGTTMPDGSIHP